MKSLIVGIAGGTGSGKSTLCYELEKKYPGKISVIHFDDYHKRPGNVPVQYGMENWDHPDSINFQLLAKDLQKLKNGKTITIQTKDKLLNPNYQTTKIRVPVKIKPKEVILVEGFLALHDPKIRQLLDLKIFLKLNEKLMLKRRDKFLNPIYESKILPEMNKKYVKPTSKFADHKIDVTDLTEKQLLKRVEVLIFQIWK